MQKRGRVTCEASRSAEASATPVCWRSPLRMSVLYVVMSRLLKCGTAGGNRGAPGASLRDCSRRTSTARRAQVSRATRAARLSDGEECSELDALLFADVIFIGASSSSVNSTSVRFTASRSSSAISSRAVTTSLSQSCTGQRGSVPFDYLLSVVTSVPWFAQALDSGTVAEGCTAGLSCTAHPRTGRPPLFAWPAGQRFRVPCCSSQPRNSRSS